MNSSQPTILTRKARISWFRLMVLFFSASFVSSNLDAQSLITGVTATASNEQPTSPASKTVDWSGMSSVQGDENASQGISSQDMWMPTNTTSSIQWDFGSSKEVVRILLWQFNFPGRAIKTAKLEHSVDGVNWTDFSGSAPATWPATDGNASDHTVVDLQNLSFTARHVKLTCLTSQGATICGVSEVLFWQDNSLRPHISSASPTYAYPIPVSVTFKKEGVNVSVTGFEASDLNVTNASVSDFNGMGHTYGFNLTPLSDPAASITVSIPAGAAYVASSEANSSIVVSDPQLHDPSRISVIDGKAVVFASGGVEPGSDVFGNPSQGLNVWYYDAATTSWQKGNDIIPTGTVPPWVATLQPWNPSGQFDAPSPDSRGRIYMTVFDEDQDIQDAIVMIEQNGAQLNSPWSDGQIVVRSTGEETGAPRSMDTSPFDSPDGKSWLAFGSHGGGIYVAEINPATGLLMQEPANPWSENNSTSGFARFTQIAWNPSTSGEGTPLNPQALLGIEAPYVYYHDGYYYLFIIFSIKY